MGCGRVDNSELQLAHYICSNSPILGIICLTVLPNCNMYLFHSSSVLTVNTLTIFYKFQNGDSYANKILQEIGSWGLPFCYKNV